MHYTLDAAVLKSSDMSLTFLFLSMFLRVGGISSCFCSILSASCLLPHEAVRRLSPNQRLLANDLGSMAAIYLLRDY